MTFFITVFLIHTLINVYLFYKGWKALPATKVARIIYGSLFFIAYSSFIIAMLLRNQLPLGVQKVLYFTGTCWLGAMLYLTFWFLITDLVRLLMRRRRTSNRIQVIAGYALVLILLIIGHYRFTHPVIVKKNIVIEKSGGNHHDLRIVAFSDIHLGVAIDRNKLQKYVQLINDQHPDLILFAGDMVDNNALPLNKEAMWEAVNQLRAPLGVYYCLGNHEYLSGIEASLDFLSKTNMTLLRDSVALVDNSFWIIGRDDKQGNPNRKSAEALAEQTDRSQPVILLDHEPYFLDEAKKNGIDLQFSGHTHSGQLFPLNWIVDKVYEVGHGYKQKGKTHIYVTSGLGLWGPPFRIGTQSELVVLDVHFAN